MVYWKMRARRECVGKGLGGERDVKKKESEG